MSLVPDPRLIDNAAEVVRHGGVIAYPTESSFGIGCDPANIKALKRILAIKQRDPDKGLILLVSDITQAADYLQPLSQAALAKIQQPRDRATTWLIPRKPEVARELCGAHSKLAVRVTNHPVARALCQALDFPLVSTSCNLAGQPALYDDCAVKVQMGEQFDLILPGECGGQSASQIIDLETGLVLRQ